jgi:hypothetical protein
MREDTVGAEPEAPRATPAREARAPRAATPGRAASGPFPRGAVDPVAGPRRAGHDERRNPFHGGLP